MTRSIAITALATAAVTLAGMLSGCATRHSPSTVTAEATPAHPLASTFKAHGGLASWQRHASLSYRMNGFPLTPQVAKTSESRVDLVNRRNRIDADAYSVGFDGNTAWATPGQDAVGLPPRFYALGSFYFIGMPFVFADEGATVQAAGTQSIGGTTYDRYNVGYDGGIGHSDADHYQVFVNRKTRQLAWINHTVTETNGDSGARVAWRFDDWQTVGDLKMPARMTFFTWADGEPQGDGAPFTIDQMRFSGTPFDAAIYTAPDA